METSKNHKLQIVKWDNSLAVRIPKGIAQQWGVREGSTIDMVVHSDHVLMRKKPGNLAAVLGRITVDNLHPEVGTGSTEGNEEW